MSVSASAMKCQIISNSVLSVMPSGRTVHIAFLPKLPIIELSITKFWSFWSEGVVTVTMLGANLSGQIPGGSNLTLTLTLNSN